MRWVIARAEGPDCPQVSCSWRWTDDPSWRVAYNGVGMGQAGIVLALDAFADRTGDPTFRAYARAGAAHLRAMTADGARPLPRGSEDDTAETGFLSGSAGAAYMFFERYRHDRDPRDLVTARRLLDWVNEQAVAARSGGLRWPLATDQPSSASGFELGAAGIAWVNLRAARATGDARYLEVARRAAVWLRHAGNAGGAWRETPADPSSPVHVGLDSGAAGIGWVLDDLAGAGLDSEQNHAAARSALASLRAGARRDRHGAFWYENRTDGPSSAARRAVVALGRGGHRRLRRPHRRLVREESRRAARRLRGFAPASGWSSLRPACPRQRGAMPGPDGEQRLDAPRFEPLRPASRGRLIAAMVLGPILWLAALVIVAWAVDKTSAIALGFAVTAGAFVIAVLVLSWVYVARRRQEKRFVEHGR